MIRLQRSALKALLSGCVGAAMWAGCASPEAPSSPETRVPPEKPSQALDPQVARIFKPMCDTLDEAKAMHFRVRAMIDRPVDTGQLAQFHRTSDVVAVRPDKLYATTESDDGNWTIWQRGQILNVLDRDDNRYAIETVPGSIGAMLDRIVEKYDLVMPMADLLAGQTYQTLTANVESSEYLGLRNVGETKCHHLLFRQENIDWQIWIQADGQPLPRKLVITYTQQPDQPQYAATIDQWELAPKVTEEMFKFTAPTGAEAVSMLDLIRENEE